MQISRFIRLVGFAAWSMLAVACGSPTDNNISDGEAGDLATAAQAANADDVAVEDPSTNPEKTSPITSSRVPNFDAIGYCRKIGDTAGGSYSIEETCRSMEDEARAKLRSVNIPSRILSYCTKIGEAAGGSFQIMDTCVEMETGAASRL